MKKIGPTGNYPEGKISNDDEGELRIAVHRTAKDVILSFGKSISWIGLPPGTARRLAKLLIKNANEVEGKA